MRSFQSTHNLFAVSALLKETAINTPQTLSHSMLLDRSAIFQFERRRESNVDEAIGLEEPDSLYNLGATASLDMAFSKGKAQEAALILAYGLGSVSTAAWGTGYKHTITPIAGDLDAARSNPSFTAAMRYGKWLHKARYASCFIDSFKMTLKRDSWLNLSAAVKATGLRSTPFLRDAIAGFADDVSITITDAVAGTTAQERVDNVHLVQYQKAVTLEWIDVAFSAVSAADPAVITITPPEGAHTATTYRVWYNRKEEGDWAWGSFPARVTEPPLRVSDFIVTWGGKWDGSSFLGGHAMNAEIKELTWEFNNGITPEFVPGGTGVYANRALREGRTQKLTVDRDFRDYIIGQRLDDNETISIRAIATGSEFETGKNYFVDIVWPLVGVMNTPYKEDGKRLGETADLVVLEDSTYGSVWTQVANKIATYAA